MLASKLREVRDTPHLTDYGVVLAIVFAMTAVTIWWVGEDTRPPNWDEGGHLYRSLFYRDHLLDLNVVTFLVTYAVYPPLVFWVTQPFYMLFGTSMSVAVASQGVFMAILAFSMYEIGRELWSRRVGLLATVFVLTLPMVVSTFHEYHLDAPLTAMTALALLCVIRTREFDSRSYSITLGVVLGLGLLTKWSVFFALSLPVAYGAFVGLRHFQATGDRARLTNIAKP
jgi:4-amino-4-deoxy-L-arabinose transferase-like glycosyltransferase